MKRAIWLIGILLLTAFALAACGGVPADTTSAEVVPLSPDPNCLVRDSAGNWYFGGEAGTVSFLLSELEMVSSAPRQSGTERHYAYDRDRIKEILDEYLPAEIVFALCPAYEVPGVGEAGEAPIQFSFDYNDDRGFFLEIDGNGRIFLYCGNRENPHELLSYLAVLPSVTHQKAEEMHRLLSDPEPQDRCHLVSDGGGYGYLLRLDEEGNLFFEWNGVRIEEFLAAEVESISLSGKPRVIPDVVLSTFPEKGQFLPSIFPQEVRFRSVSLEDEEKSKAVVAATRWLHASVDWNDNRSCYIFVAPDGQIVVIDHQGHCYISEPGACDGQAALNYAAEVVSKRNKK